MPVSDRCGKLLAYSHTNASRRRAGSEHSKQLYLTMICGVTCGISLSGPTFAFCIAERNLSAGATESRIGGIGCW